MQSSLGVTCVTFSNVAAPSAATPVAFGERDEPVCEVELWQRRHHVLRAEEEQLCGTVRRVGDGRSHHALRRHAATACAQLGAAGVDGDAVATPRATSPSSERARAMCDESWSLVPFRNSPQMTNRWSD